MIKDGYGVTGVLRSRCYLRPIRNRWIWKYTYFPTCRVDSLTAPTESIDALTGEILRESQMFIFNRSSFRLHFVQVQEGTLSGSGTHLVPYLAGIARPQILSQYNYRTQEPQTRDPKHCEFVLCFNCYEKGHRTSCCTKAIPCFLCNQMNNLSADCRNAPSTGQVSILPSGRYTTDDSRVHRVGYGKRYDEVVRESNALLQNVATIMPNPDKQGGCSGCSNPRRCER